MAPRSSPLSTFIRLKSEPDFYGIHCSRTEGKPGLQVASGCFLIYFQSFAIVLRYASAQPSLGTLASI